MAVTVAAANGAVDVNQPQPKQSQQQNQQQRWAGGTDEAADADADTLASPRIVPLPAAHRPHPAAGADDDHSKAMSRDRSAPWAQLAPPADNSGAVQSIGVGAVRCSREGSAPLAAAAREVHLDFLTEVRLFFAVWGFFCRGALVRAQQNTYLHQPRPAHTIAFPPLHTVALLRAAHKHRHLKHAFAPNHP